ncbi:peroxisome membrane protein [Coniochaeta ligniaria NRRL 30616]|uniref:Peroxisomal membrane protein PEX16 n=1 Tax=Coniochaeta ligniaria NRRL 30616 TaxID=1408157 RepID=A0A1J7JBT6_9PEZI|nr:peroxisome membrane protein [Coniochaeta ligniaria NRRL 30616]
MSAPADVNNKTSWSFRPSSVQNVLSLPPKWLHIYDDYITKNASQVSQIESGLRSLTYIIPGRFRDAEIAAESIHSGVQLLSLYHDTILSRALGLSKLPVPPPLAAAAARGPSAHNRYTSFWARKSALYRRVAYVLQIVQYTELLCEMAAKRRSERVRWRVVVLIEAVKALCRLLLLRITRSRPVVTPALPERVDIPEPAEAEDDGSALSELMGERTEEDELRDEDARRQSTAAARNPHTQEWSMPRTGMTMPSLPPSGDISSYLLSRVLTADDVKPATKLLSQLRGPAAHAAEVLHILAPLIYAVALATSALRYNQKDGKRRHSWYPWLIGVGVELAARQLRDPSLRTTPLEREEWNRRGWAMGWWAMRGAAYEGVVKGVVEGVRKRVPNIVGGILEDYEYLWENYYFSTSP